MTEASLGGYPLVAYLKARGFELGRHVPPGEPVSPRDEATLERTRFLVAPRAEAENVLEAMVEAFMVYEGGITEDDLRRLEDALRDIKRIVEGQYQHPLLLPTLPLGNPAGDIIRRIEEVLPR